MKTFTLALLIKVGLAFILTAGIVLTPASAHAASPKVAACQAEDGPGPCYWDATQRGNHKGASFWISPKGAFLYDRRWTEADGHVTSNWRLVCPKDQHVAPFRAGKICKH